MKKIKKLFDVLIRIIIGISLYIFDSLAIIFFGIKKNYQNNILIVRTDRIGDYFLWASQLEVLCKHFSAMGGKLTLVANKTWAPLVSLQGININVIELDIRRFNFPSFYRVKIARLLMSGGYETVLNPIYSRDFFRSDALVRFSRAKNRIGFNGASDRAPKLLKIISNSFYSKLIDIDSSVSEIEKNALFLSGVGINSAAKFATFKFDDEKLPFGLVKNQYFVICPGASSNNRMWSAENYISVIKFIQEKYKFNGVICGDSSDSVVAKKINAVLEIKLLDLTGKTTITQLTQIISISRLLITNESGAAHIAGTYNVPSVVIVGGGHFGRFLPYSGVNKDPSMEIACHVMECYGCGWNCRYTLDISELVPCIEGVEVHQVIQKVEKVLSTTEVLNG